MSESSVQGAGRGGEVAARTIGDYAAAVAAGQATPGGGSAAGVAAALGAGLGEMVCNLTGPAKLPPDGAAELIAARDRLAAARATFLTLAAEDEAAYGGYRAAAALPKSDEIAKAARRRAMQAALVAASDVPRDLAEACVGALLAFETVARLGSRYVLADARLGAALLATALEGALVNLRANAALLDDAELASQFRVEADRLETRARASVDRVEVVSVERG